MSVHLNRDQSGVVGVFLNRIPERRCWPCAYRTLNVFIQMSIVLKRSECG